MDIVFRVDSSIDIGTGHVIRCLTLAKSLREKGCFCKFICRDHIGNLKDQIVAEGFDISVLKTNSSKILDSKCNLSLSKHSKWLKVSWQEDALQTIKVLSSSPVDWLIVDNYSLDKKWEQMIRPFAHKIMVIDDLADREHDCDILIDQNMLVDFENRYMDLVPNSCSQLLGSKYALLQDSFSKLMPLTHPRNGMIERILIFFGGYDKHNLTFISIEAFLRLKRNDINLDVVINPNNPFSDRIKEQVKVSQNMTVYDTLPSLAPLMKVADFAIGAGGVTSLERCCLGLPSIVVSIADNQRQIAKELENLGLIKYIGHYDTINVSKILEHLDHVINCKSFMDWSKSCMEKVDGLGTKRVSTALTINNHTELFARLANIEEENLLFRWANEPQVRKNAFNSDLISFESHSKWFKKRLENPANCYMYIIETKESLPIGQVRFDQENDYWIISYSLDVFARGVGLGKHIIEVSLEKFLRFSKNGLILAKVKKNNFASIKIFDSLGYAKIENREYYSFFRRIIS